MMKRSSNGAEYEGATKIRKQNGPACQTKILKFQGNEVRAVVDNRGVIWFSWLDVTRALDIHAVPTPVYDLCVRKRYIRPLSDISVSDSSTILPGNTLLIVAEGVHRIESRLGRPRERQFIESLLELLDTLTTVNHHQAQEPENEQVKNPLAQEVERLKAELAKQDEERRKEKAKFEEEKRLAAKKLEKWKNVVQNLKSRDPTQIVYIATCRRYALENNFKIGGVKNIEQLRGRLAVMNTARTPEDKLYYCFWVYCSNHRRLEQRIADVVGEHRIQRQEEMYNLHYYAVKEVVEYLAERFNEEEERYKGMFESLIQETLEKEPVVPDPIVLNGVEHRQIRQALQANAEYADVGTVQQSDFDSMVEQEKYNLVANMLDEYIKSMMPLSAPANANGENSGLTRKNFENYLSGQGVKFAKRSLWKVLRVVAQSKKVFVKY